MHYYKRNIGDYSKKAGRLTMLQHGAYTLLMDAIYDRERFPNLDEALDWTWASTPGEKSAVEFVLGKFFTKTNGKYYQKRIGEVLEKYQSNAAINKRIAEEREAKRRRKSTKRVRTVNEPPPNQEPLTTNHNKKTGGFAPPTQQEVTAYWAEKNLLGDPEVFFDHFTSNGWKVSGKAPMKDWKAAARNWSKREVKNGTHQRSTTGSKHSEVVDRLAAKIAAEPR